MRQTKFHFIVPIWGKEYIDIFQNLCVPLLLSKNNIDILYERPIFTLCIKKEEKIFFNSQNFKKLAELVDLRYIYHECCTNDINIVSVFNEEFKKMTACHNEAIRLVNQEGIGHCFLMPDSILFDGALKNLKKIVNTHEDKKVFLSYGVHAELEAIQTIFNQYSCQHSNYKSIDINYYDFCSIVFKNLHAMSLNSFVESENYFATGNMFFKDQMGYVLKMNILHPLVIFLEKDFYAIPNERTWDNSLFIQKNITNNEDIYYIEDTRLFFLSSVDSKKQKSTFYENFGGVFNFIDNALYINKHINSFFVTTSFSREGRVYLSEKNVTKALKKAKKYEYKTLQTIKLIQEAFNEKFDWDEIQMMILNEEQGKLKSFNDSLKKFCFAHRKIIEKCELNIPDLDKCNRDNKREIIENLKNLLNVLGEGKRFISCVERYKSKIEQFDKCLNEHQRIAIYGAGDDTKMVMNLMGLDAHRIQVVFDDAEHKQGTAIYGINIKKIEDYNLKNLDCIIINSSLYGEKIYKRIKEKCTQLVICLIS
ncbi:MAG: hypothetical protein JW802_04995 [Campylobacterales bacterium]|nr:hypothetical protein [Campylobacterales bacterium]